jgi:hypothetical protein
VIKSNVMVVLSTFITRLAPDQLMCGPSLVAPSRWMAAHMVARSREIAAPPLIAARVPAPADWKSAVKVMMAARLPAQQAPADWRSAVELMWAAKDIHRAVGSVVSWLKLQPGY